MFLVLLWNNFDLGHRVLGGLVGIDNYRACSSEHLIRIEISRYRGRSEEFTSFFFAEEVRFDSIKRQLAARGMVQTNAMA